MFIRDWFKGKKRHRKTDPHSGMKSSSWQQVGSKTHRTCTGTSIGHFWETLACSDTTPTAKWDFQQMIPDLCKCHHFSSWATFRGGWTVSVNFQWNELICLVAMLHDIKQRAMFPPLSVKNSPREASVETRLSISSYFLVHRSFFNNTWTFIPGLHVGGLCFCGIGDGHAHFFRLRLISWSELRLGLPGWSLQSGMVWIIPNVDRQIGVQWLQLFGQELISQWVQSIWAPVQPCALQ